MNAENGKDRAATEQANEVGDSRTMRRHARDLSRVSVMGWIGTIVLSTIPVINIVLWFAWAFSARKPSRRTYAAAMLILTLFMAILVCAVIMAHGQDIVTWVRKLDPEYFENAFRG